MISVYLGVFCTVLCILWFLLCFAVFCGVLQLFWQLTSIHLYVVVFCGTFGQLHVCFAVFCTVLRCSVLFRDSCSNLTSIDMYDVYGGFLPCFVVFCGVQADRTKTADPTEPTLTQIIELHLQKQCKKTTRRYSKRWNFTTLYNKTMAPTTLMMNIEVYILYIFFEVIECQFIAA